MGRLIATSLLVANDQRAVFLGGITRPMKIG